MASRALSEPRNPLRPGPWGKQRTGPNRTLQLTDAGREAIHAYRAALAAQSPSDWRVVHRMYGPPWYVRWVRADEGGEVQS